MNINRLLENEPYFRTFIEEDLKEIENRPFFPLLHAEHAIEVIKGKVIVTITTPVNIMAATFGGWPKAKNIETFKYITSRERITIDTAVEDGFINVKNVSVKGVSMTQRTPKASSLMMEVVKLCTEEGVPFGMDF